MPSLPDRTSLTKSTLIDRVARVDLRVRDVEAALSFYRDVVGLEVVERDDTRALLGAPGGPVFLSLRSTGVTMPADPRATGLFHVAIRFPTRSALGDVLARVSAAGYQMGAGDHLVSEALYVDDPDGNGVELYWDRPVEQWPPPTEDMVVPMATLPVDLRAVLNEGRGRAAVGDKAPARTEVGHVHLQVSDIGPTTRFYAEQLGLDLIARLGNQASFFSSNGYHHHIGANTWRSLNGRPSSRESAGLDRVTFAVGDADRLEGLRLRLGDLAGKTSDDGAVIVVDPDEIELQFAVAGAAAPD
ncbi:MAG: VOC family protein [Actinomycetota bacterium]|nr:VOC family protein [Actinomycetota bacterium]